jgi:hypothetical protein
MKMRSLRFIACMSCFTLISVAVQFNNSAQAKRVVRPPRVYVEPQATVIEEAKGIEFTVVSPEQPIEIPEEGKSVPIKLGLRITNTSLVEREILSAPGLLVVLTKSQPPKEIVRGCNSNGPGLIVQERYSKILKPGESIETFDESASLNKEDGVVSIVYNTPGAGSCWYSGLKPGRYSVMMDYIGFQSRINSSRGELILLKSTSN